MIICRITKLDSEFRCMEHFGNRNIWFWPVLNFLSVSLWFCDPVSNHRCVNARKLVRCM